MLVLALLRGPLVFAPPSHLTTQRLCVFGYIDQVARRIALVA